MKVRAYTVHAAVVSAIVSGVWVLSSAAPVREQARKDAPSQDTITAAPSEDRTPRVAIVLSSFKGAADHDGTALAGLARPRPVDAAIGEAELAAMVRKAIELGNRRNGGIVNAVEPNAWVVVKVLSESTDPRMVRALLEYLAERKRGKRFSIADRGRAWGGTWDGLVRDLSSRHADRVFELLDLDTAEAMEMPVPGVHLTRRARAAVYRVPRALLHSDCLISVAPLGFDQARGPLLSIENYRGFAAGGAGTADEVAADLFTYHPANYAILGGTVVRVAGAAVTHNLVLAGMNPVSVDAVAAAVLGLEPYQSPTLRIAERKGFGGLDLDLIWTRGNEVEEARVKLPALASWRPKPAEFHVTVDGLGSNDGAADSPWSLKKALGEADWVKPGDTILVHGGVYRGGFECRLRGTEAAPVVVRAAPGERVVIDARGHDVAGLHVLGEWTVIRDLEITDTDPDRTRERPTGVYVRGPHTRLANLVVHDCGVGIGFWTEAVAPAEVRACLIYNNGWQGPAPDRGHGHAIYTQNREGVKRLVDNIMFNQFGYGIHAYGSSRAFLKGFHIEGNISFENGSLSRGRTRANNILVGGGAAAEGVVLRGNHLFHSSAAASLRLGFGPVNKDVEACGNHITGGARVNLWEKVFLQGNTIAPAGAAVELDLPKGRAASSYQWDANTYVEAGGKPARFRIRSGEREESLDFASWRRATGLDGSSRTFEGRREAEGFVRAVAGEPGRAHIIVYNRGGASSVVVDLGAVLERGQRFEVRDAQDYFGAPVLEAEWRGSAVTLPLAVRSPAAVVGETPEPPRHTGPEFFVFVVRAAGPGRASN